MSSMDGTSNDSATKGGASLLGVVARLREASVFAGGRLGTDPAWDLVYCQLGVAILAIQACTPEDMSSSLDLAGDDGQEPDSVDATECVALIEAAAQDLRVADLGARPGLTVAVTAVADVRALLREVAA